jgi:hypothetical protein
MRFKFGELQNSEDAAFQMVQSTVVQSTYAPQINVGAVGMVADEATAEVGTRINETAAGLPFGVAVSQGTLSDKGCLIGGTAFVGITVRDVTLDRMPINPLAAGGVYPPVDNYQQYANVGVLSRGDIWVLAGADVTAGNALYYEATGGTLSNSGSGTSATGSITFTSQPQPGDQIVIAGSMVAFATAGSSDSATEIVTVGGTIANGDAGVLTLTSTALAGSPLALSIPVVTADTTATVAAKLAAAINGNAALAAIDVSASVVGSVVTIEQPTALTPQVTFAKTNGTAITFTLTTGAAVLLANVDPTLGDTIRLLAAALNASTDTNLVKFKYLAYPPSPGGAGEGSGVNTRIVAAAAVGTGGSAHPRPATRSPSPPTSPMPLAPARRYQTGRQTANLAVTTAVPR